MAAAQVKALVAGKAPVQGPSLELERELAWKELWATTQQALPATGCLREAYSAAGMQADLDADMPEFLDTLAASADPGSEACPEAPPGLGADGGQSYAARAPRDPYMLSPTNRPPDASPDEHLRRPRSRSRPHPYGGPASLGRRSGSVGGASHGQTRRNSGSGSQDRGAEWSPPKRIPASKSTSRRPRQSADRLREGGDQWAAATGQNDPRGGRRRSEWRRAGQDAWRPTGHWHLMSEVTGSREPRGMRRRGSRLEHPPTLEVFWERPPGRVRVFDQCCAGFSCSEADRGPSLSHIGDFPLAPAKGLGFAFRACFF